MVFETPNLKSDLLPLRYPQQDLFICDVANAVLKDIMQHMEHPFYALSKRPDTRIRRYEHNGNWLEIVPSVKGLATIYDQDILIYCISQIIAKLKKGEKVSQYVQINSYELLIFTNRGTGGKDYKALSQALDRLEGTRIRTNIKTGDEEQFSAFGLIDGAALRRKHGLDGRLLWCEIKLSDWVFNAICSNEVLTLHPDYFRLRKPLERRVYELARKHCGQQPKWSISFEKLLKKSGSQSPMKVFKQLIKGLVQNDHLPDYMVAINAENVVFLNRNTLSKQRKRNDSDVPMLKPETFENARRVAPGYDVYRLQREWISHWMASGKPELKTPDGAFVNFCKKRYQSTPIYE